MYYVQCIQGLLWDSQRFKETFAKCVERDVQNIQVNFWPWQCYKLKVVYALESLRGT